MGMSCARAGGAGTNSASTSSSQQIRKEPFAARRRALDGFPSLARLARRSPGMTRLFTLPNAVLTAGGPDDALAHFRRRRHAFIIEALDAFSFIGFGRIQIAFGINGDAVHAI